MEMKTGDLPKKFLKNKKLMLPRTRVLIDLMYFELDFINQNIA